MKVKTAKLSLCQCGFPLLNDSIPIGTEYEIKPEKTVSATLTCCGCGKQIQVVGVWTEKRIGNDTGEAGFMPREIFNLPG